MKMSIYSLYFHGSFTVRFIRMYYKIGLYRILNIAINNSVNACR